MGGNYVGNAATFLIETLFFLYILVVMLRFLLQLVRADFYNPISQGIVKITQPPLGILRRFVPGFAGIDLSAVVLMLALKFVELWLVHGMLGRGTGVGGLLVLSVGQLLSMAVYLFIVTIFIQVIAGWLNPGAYNPALSLLHKLNEPLLAPARRAIPPISGLDLSPIAVLIVLQLVSMLVVSPILDAGYVLLGE